MSSMTDRNFLPRAAAPGDYDLGEARIAFQVRGESWSRDRILESGVSCKTVARRESQQSLLEMAPTEKNQLAPMKPRSMWAVAHLVWCT